MSLGDFEKVSLEMTSLFSLETSALSLYLGSLYVLSAMIFLARQGKLDVIHY